MADKKISALTSLAQGDVAASTDVLPIVDTSATETKKITASALVGAGMTAGVTNVDINSGAIDGTTIGANSAAAGTFTNLTASGTVSFSGATVSNGGAVTTIDINGGTIDGTTIGGGTAAAGTFTTVGATTGNITTVNATTVDSTNLEVTNLKAKDGTAAGSIADATGVVTLNSLVATTADINGGTIDATSIGASSASTGAFTTLSASSTVSGTGFSTYLASPPAIGGTTAAAGSFTTLTTSSTVTLNGGTANGVLYLNGSKVATSGSALTFDGTNVGIGTSSPAFALGSGLEVERAGIATLRLENSSGSNGIEIAADSTTNGIRFYGLNNAPFVFAPNATERARIDSSGRFGIGTETNALTNVLTLYRTGSTQTAMAAGNSNAGLNGTLFGVDTAGNAIVNQTQNFATIFSTNNTERARITSGGYSKFSNNGAYVSSTGSYHELYVSGAAGDWTTRVTNATATAANCYGMYIKYSGAAPINTGNDFLYCEDSTPQLRMSVRSNGGIANYSANDVNLSDERTKKDIVPLGSMWDKFKAIEIVAFKYKDQTHEDNNIGVIAQQVESVAPEFVDADGWGETPEGEEPLKSIYTADMYHAAIKALQEAMTRIEQLEAKVAVLESK